MRFILLIILFAFSTLHTVAQLDSPVQQQPPTAPVERKPRPRVFVPKPVAPPADTQRLTVSANDTTTALIDTTARDVADSIASSATDSVLSKQVMVYQGMDSFYLKLINNPYLQMTEPPLYLVIKERVQNDKDEVFYLLAGLLLYLAFIKLIFPKYFSNVFRLFFQPSFRQKQTREQLLQSALPSLLLNLFFIFSGGAFVALVVSYYQFSAEPFWLLFLYCSLGLLVLYAGKFLFLTFAGWVFNVKQAADTYGFMVYLINKIIGVVLVPFILIIAFSEPRIIDIAITLSMLLIAVLFIYRFIAAFTPVRREVKVSVLHFLMYVFAFEISPLLLIYKTFIIYLGKSL